VEAITWEVLSAVGHDAQFGKRLGSLEGHAVKDRDEKNPQGNSKVNDRFVDMQGMSHQHTTR
jgi:hypothetical protein